MGLFSKDAQPGGLIVYNGLSEWWLVTFLPADREVLEHLFAKASIVGSRQIRLTTGGQAMRTCQSAAQLLVELAALAERPRPDLVPLLLAKGEEVAGSGDGVLDLHFLYSFSVNFWYRRRDEAPNALAAAIVACQKQIAMGPSALEALRRTDIPPVSHRGYQQLAIIREKQGDLAEALRLSREAQSQGWMDAKRDWQPRIARLQRRLSASGGRAAS